ncbi:hypothetical protein ACFWBN_20240 [Streptomyces sp. NPDC059989]|uniref:hypothetical protein n=1 Tax=Streptomyces sp. NPDC059989 TaxID=3347026 RepID=UPI00369147A4
MGAARQRLWEVLHGLSERAAVARSAQGLSASQGEVEKALKASGRPGAQGFPKQRISDWAPKEASELKIPQVHSDDRVVALATLWGEWAQVPVSERELRDLLDRARDEQAREKRTSASGRAPAGRRTILDLTPGQLWVGEALLPGSPGSTTAPALTPYLIRDHDHALREYLKYAVASGTSILAVLTGDSSTGKTRALYEALLEVAPDLGVLRPQTARNLLDLLPGDELREGCVLWLDELQRIVHDREGEKAAAELTTVLQERPGIIAVATLWEDPYWREFTTQGRREDPHRHTRALLTGAHARRFKVPRELTAEERGRWGKLALDQGDARLRSAERAGAADGRVVQHLAGGPELLAAYLSGPGGHFTPREHALVTAALEARRLGHQLRLPRALLAAAADGALALHDHASCEDWAGPELEALTGGVRADGSRADIRSTLTPLRALREFAGAPPRYEPADYLLQHTAPRHGDRAGSVALWEALVRQTEDAEDLHRLQAAAWKRGLFGHALRLDRRAALAGAADACVRIVERTTRHPDAAKAAAWAAAHADVSNGGGLDGLFAALRASGSQESVDTLARRLVAEVDPADVRAVGALAGRLADRGVSAEVTEALGDSLAVHVDRIDPDAIVWALPDLARAGAHQVVARLAPRAAAHADLAGGWSVSRLLHVLDTVGAPDAVAVLVARIVAEAPRMDPDELPWLMRVLRQAGAEQALRTLLALDPAARIGLTEADVVLCLLRVLRQAGDEEGVRTLLGRSLARHVDVVGRPDFYDVESVLCELLTELRDLGAEDEFTELADRVAAGVSLESAEAVASLLNLFHTAGRAGATRQLLGRKPIDEVYYFDPAELSSLLTTLLRTGSVAEFDALASAVVHDTDFTNPDFVEEVVQVLWATGAERGIDPLMRRALAHTPYGDMVFVVRQLSEAGALEGALRLARHIAEHVESPSVDTMDFMLWFLHEAGASEAVGILLDRGLVDLIDAGTYGDWHTLAGLLETLCEMGVTETARAFADRAAVGIDLADTMGIGYLLTTMTAHGLREPREVLIRRAATGADLTHMNSVARLIEEFLAAGAAEAVDELLRRDPLARIDRGWTTDSCHEALLTALGKAGSPQADEFARWAREAGRLPVESLLPYGLEPGGLPAAPWPWPDRAMEA